MLFGDLGGKDLKFFDTPSNDAAEVMLRDFRSTRPSKGFALPEHSLSEPSCHVMKKEAQATRDTAWSCWVNSLPAEPHLQAIPDQGPNM